MLLLLCICSVLILSHLKCGFHSTLCSPTNEINYLLCFEYEGKVIDALKERFFVFCFFFEVQRTDWRRFLNLLTDFCHDDDFQQPKGSRQGD